MKMDVLVRTDRVAGDIIANALRTQGIATQLVSLPGMLRGGVVEWVQLLVEEKNKILALNVVEHFRLRHPRMPLDFIGDSELPPPVV